MQGITKEYFGNRVLTDVSLDVNRGEILGLVGENGAGKSTLMNILFGMSVIAQTGGYSGKVSIDGKEVNFQNPFDALKAGIGMVHQEFSLIPGFTATENILLNGEILHDNIVTKLFGPRLKTLDLPEMRAIAEKSIELLGVEISPDTLVAEMPVGHKQFTELAREIHRPEMKVLVLDEPTAVLTESEAQVLLTSLRKLAATGIAIIFITHRLQEILDICDRIVILRDGQVVKEVATRDTDIGQVAELMVGRDVSAQSAVTSDYNESTKTIISVDHLWVDMPGETVKDVTLEVHKGEIFGIGGLAGQGKLGIPNGIMGLYTAGGAVTLHGKPIHLNDPAAALAAGMAFVSEDRRAVGLLLEEALTGTLLLQLCRHRTSFSGHSWVDSSNGATTRPSRTWLWNTSRLWTSSVQVRTSEPRSYQVATSRRSASPKPLQCSQTSCSFRSRHAASTSGPSRSCWKHFAPTTARTARPSSWSRPSLKSCGLFATGSPSSTKAASPVSCRHPQRPRSLVCL